MVETADTVGGGGVAEFIVIELSAETIDGHAVAARGGFSKLSIMR